MTNVTIVLGTARKERSSHRAYLALQQAFSSKEGVQVVGVDVREYVTVAETVPNWGVGGSDTAPSKWKDVVEQTDTFVFILPEYNHSFPGEWKILIDSLSSEYSGKKAYVVGVSAGLFSGVRVSDHVKIVLIELNFLVHKFGLQIGKVKDVIDEDGKVVDEAFGTRLSKFTQQVLGE